MENKIEQINVIEYIKIRKKKKQEDKIKENNKYNKVCPCDYGICDECEKL